MENRKQLKPPKYTWCEWRNKRKKRRMRIFGKPVFPGQIMLFASGYVFKLNSNYLLITFCVVELFMQTKQTGFCSWQQQRMMCIDPSRTTKHLLQRSRSKLSKTTSNRCVAHLKIMANILPRHLYKRYVCVLEI